MGEFSISAARAAITTQSAGFHGDRPRRQSGQPAGGLCRTLDKAVLVSGTFVAETGVSLIPLERMRCAVSHLHAPSSPCRTTEPIGLSFFLKEQVEAGTAALLHP
jgi:hypothetical protein